MPPGIHVFVAERGLANRRKGLCYLYPELGADIDRGKRVERADLGTRKRGYAQFA
jgi:hypothetical protein